MAFNIKVADYHSEPLGRITCEDGTVIAIRKPREADYYRMQEVETAHRERRLAWLKERRDEANRLAEEASAKAAELEDEDAGRELIAERLALLNTPDPIEVTDRYRDAELLAIFVEPATDPAKLLELGPGIIHDAQLAVIEELNGEATKKRGAPQNR